MISLPAFLLGLLALVRLVLYLRQRGTLLGQGEHPSRNAACNAALDRARRLLRAEFARVLAAVFFMILIAVCAWGGWFGPALTVAMALAAYLAESVIAARATTAGLKGRTRLLAVGSVIAAAVAWASSLLVTSLSWGLWLLAMILISVGGIGIHQLCDWLWLRPHRERRSPLVDDALLQRLRFVARECGVQGTQFLVIEGDERTINARAESDPRGHRVVLWPALMKRLGPTELDAVIAHELGHLARHHLRARFVGIAVNAGMAIGLASLVSACFWAPGGIQATLHAATAAVLLPLILSVLRCVQLALYRQQEIEADEFVRGRGWGGVLADALLKLSPSMAVEPESDAWHHLAYDSHPSIHRRLAHLRSSI